MAASIVRVTWAIAMLTAFAIVAEAAQQHAQLTDQQIKAQVEHRLLDHDIRGVVVAVRDGTVTLSGTVRSLWAKEEAFDEAQEVDDVKDVVSTLTVMRGESDQAVGEAVASRLRRYVFFTIFDDVDVELTDGIETLTGSVPMPYKSQAMVELASRVDGVQQVVDKLEVLPVSGFDDQIRYAAAVRIYNDPLFWNYAIQVDPPIHVVVRHGRVTLTGVVISEVERRKADVIARGVFGVFSVDNKLRLEGDEK
jgi:osmotically-inducible protein OsmY